jgi:predicted glycoside hydrolase/deacetylase ChbG (UPF0249 family)
MDVRRMTRLLIVDADDLGLAPGVTEGILELAGLGSVTSTSVLINMPGGPEALRRARAAGLDAGVHLNLCAGTPLTPPDRVTSLLCPDGRFASARTIISRLFIGRLRLAEVEREWAAQIDRHIAIGGPPSHLDTHLHMHALPDLYRIIMRLAQRYGISGVRCPMAGYLLQAPRLPLAPVPLGRVSRVERAPRHTDHFSVLTAQGRVRTARPLQALLRALPAGVTELVCHPGHVDDELRRIDPLTSQRERDWLQLARPSFQDALRREGIRLVTWADLSATGSSFLSRRSTPEITQG